MSTSRDTTYNGWTNYATWRVNLEILDGMNLSEDFGDERDTYTLSKTLESYVEEIMDCEPSSTLVRSYADAFLSDVNYYEIAEHMISDAVAEETN